MQPERRIARCANAHRYKGNRPPICNGGQPCSACRSKWYRAEQARKAKQQRPRPQNGEAVGLDQAIVVAGVFVAETFNGSGNWVVCSRLSMPDSLGGYFPSRSAAEHAIAECAAEVIAAAKKGGA